MTDTTYAHPRDVSASGHAEGVASLQEAFAKFQREYPEVVVAMETMNLTFPEYLEALMALHQEPPVVTSDNNVRGD